eukprot:gene34506-44592_t
MSGHFDLYNVLEELGSGTYGKVCKVRRKFDGKDMVWKEINFGAMCEKEKTQLVAEVNILRELRNPFIVRYHDRIVDKATTRLFIIMEYCAGGDLSKVIQNCRKKSTYLDESFIWKVFAQSVLALKECHRRNPVRPVLHRDIKPANILMDASHNIKIGDFGLAKELGGRSGFLAKTNALGCVLYELATLKPPFEAHNVVSLGMKINAGTFPPMPTSFSLLLNKAIRSMLQVDPARRPGVEELEALMGEKSEMQEARRILSEFQQQQLIAQKLRSLKAKEEELGRKEMQLQEKEKRLLEWEATLEKKALQLCERGNATTYMKEFSYQNDKIGVNSASTMFARPNNYGSTNTGGGSEYHSSSMVTNTSINSRNNTKFEIYVDAQHQLKKDPAPSSSSRGNSAHQQPSQPPPLYRHTYKTASNHTVEVAQQQPPTTGFPSRSHTHYQPPGPIVTGAEKEKENLFTAPSGRPQYTTSYNEVVRQKKDGFISNKRVEDTSIIREGNNDSS